MRLLNGTLFHPLLIQQRRSKTPMTSQLQLKKVLITSILISALFVLPQGVRAQTTTPSSISIVPTDRLGKIRELKERVATRVAQLKKEGEYVVGEVKLATDSMIMLNTNSGEIKILPNSNATIVLLTQKPQSITSGTLTSGQLLYALGKKEDTVFKATDIVARPPRINLVGKISSIDKPNGTFLLGYQAGTITIDINKTTLTFRYTKGKGLERSGFSKLLVEDRVVVVGSPTDTADKVSALRIVTIPNPLAITPSPTIATTETPTPTTSKVIKPSPKPTTKPTL